MLPFAVPGWWQEEGSIIWSGPDWGCPGAAVGCGAALLGSYTTKRFCKRRKMLMASAPALHTNWHMHIHMNLAMILNCRTTQCPES